MPDELLQALGRVQPLVVQKREIFAETHLVAIDPVTVEPNTPLRQFRIVELRAEAVRVVINADRAH